MSTASRWILTKNKTNPLSFLSVTTDPLKAHTYYSPLFSADSRPRRESFPRQHMLRFTFHPRPLMRSALGQSRPACQHVMADLWAKGTAASSRGFLKNANRSQCEAPPSARSLARCEHAQQRRSSRHGNIARLYAGCSPPQTPPTHPPTLIYRF